MNPAPSSRPIPLTTSQVGMWLREEAFPHNRAMVSAVLIEVTGPLDESLLCEAIRRTAIESDCLHVDIELVEGVPHQRIRATRTARVEYHDLRGEDSPDTVADRLRAERYARGIRLTGQLVNLTVVRCEDTRWRIHLEGHHLVIDGMGAASLAARVAEHYRSLTGGPEPQPIGGLADLVAEEQAYLASPANDDDRAYWTRIAATERTLTEYGSRPWCVPTGELIITRDLDDARVAALREVARSLTVPWPSLLVALTAHAVARATGHRDVALTIPAARRTTPLSRITPAMYVNFPPLFVTVDPWEPRADYVRRVATAFKDTLRRQAFPAGAIRQLLGLSAQDERPWGPTVNILGYGGTIDFGTATGVLHLLSTGPVDDVQVTYESRANGGMRVHWAANPEMYSETEAREALDALLDTVTHADDIPAGETAVHTSGDALTAGPDLDILACLITRAATHPDGCAIVEDGPAGSSRETSYSQLLAAVRARTAALRQHGVLRGDVIAVMGAPTGQLLTSILAVWACGAVYLPLDGDSPADRSAGMMAEASARCLLNVDGAALNGLVELLPPETRVVLPAPHPPTLWSGEAEFETHRAQDLAYIIFTSGSTGRPKGAAVSWAGFHNHLSAKIADLVLTSTDRVAMSAPLIFDISIWQLTVSLLTGGSVRMVPRHVAVDAGALIRTVASDEVSILEVVPSLLRPIVDEWAAETLEVPPALRTVISTGEALPADLCATWSSHQPGIHLVNAYGPTECSDDVTHWTMPPGPYRAGTRVPIGRAIPGALLYVLDYALRPVAAGATGELYVGGTCVGLGYVNMAARTATTFLADPFSPHAGARMYRTGDRVRRLGDGNLEYIERVDNQTKLRGFRIELGEIETALRDIDGVDDAVVTVVGEGESRQLCGYLVGDATPDHAQRTLATRLPGYLVPTAWVPVPELPVTPNGKVNRLALPQPDLEGHSTPEGAEGSLADLVTQQMAILLGRPRVGLHDNFFAIGGNSLLAIRLVSALRNRLGLTLGFAQVFDTPTAEQLARAARQHEAATPPPLDAGPSAGPVPASSGQRRLWLLQHFDPANLAYQITVRREVDADTDLDALTLAVADLAARHPALRTRLVWRDDRLYQHVANLDDARLGLVERERVAADGIDAWVAARRAIPLTLGTALPLRVDIATLPSGSHVMLIAIHHAACDGWSLRTLLADLTVAYAARSDGRAPAWATDPVSYADYARWQASDAVTESPWLAQQRTFWSDSLASIPPALTWPPRETTADAPPTAVDAGEVDRTGHLDLVIPAELNERVRALCADSAVTPFTVLHAALGTVLATLCDQGEVLIGTATHGRPLPQLDATVGFFANTVLLRTPGDTTLTWHEILRRCRDGLIAAVDNGDLPYDEIVAAGRARGTTIDDGTLQVMLTYQSGSAAVAADTMRVLPVEHARFDLVLECDEPETTGPRPILCRMEYALRVIDRTLAERIASALLVAVTRMVAAPDAVIARPRPPRPPALPEPCVQPPTLDTPDADPGTALALLLSGLARQPESPAVTSGQERLSHQQLDECSSQLARHLLGMGLGRGDTVAVLLPRSTGWVVALLAILKTGAAFLPIDAHNPAARVAAMLADTTSALSIVDSNTVHLLPAEARRLQLSDPSVRAEIAAQPGYPVASIERPRSVRPDDLAYVVFTSGSTGHPKGVGATHRGLRNLLERERAIHEGDNNIRMLHFAATGFDAAVWEVGVALTTGGQLIIPSEDERTPGYPLAEFISAHRVNLACLPPSVLTLVPPRAELPSDLRVMVGGERCSTDLLTRWAARVTLVNGYGPSEATVYTTVSDTLVTGGSTSIGRPITGCRVWVLDTALRPVPRGVEGELYIAGDALARGYVGRPGLTAARFIAAPEGMPGERMYRTGDVVRWNNEGTLDFVGRVDSQVKIRGNRVEPEETRAALVALPYVLEAVVIVREDRPGDQRLVAYTVYADDLPIDSHAVRDRLATVLPDHLVPHAIVALDELPRGINGKVDSTRLPAPDGGSASADSNTRMPGTDSTDSTDDTLNTDAVDRVCAACAEVLGRTAVSPHDDFVRLGGDSIMAVMVVSRLRDRGLLVSAQQVLQLRTPAALAAVATVPLAAPGPEQHRGDMPVPPIAEWLRSHGSSVAGFSQSVLIGLPAGTTPAHVEDAVASLLLRHPMLTARLVRNGEEGRWLFRVAEPGGDRAALPLVPLTPDTGEDTAALADVTAWPAAPLDPDAGRLVRGVVYTNDAGHAEALGLEIHHLVVDGVSWRVLVEDLASALAALAAGEQPVKMPSGSPYREWVEALWASAGDSAHAAESDLWLARLANAPAPVATALRQGRPLLAARQHAAVDVMTTRVARDLVALDGADVELMLLSAYVSALAEWRVGRGHEADVLIRVEAHGRQSTDLDVDVSSTVGWFTSEWPLRVSFAGDSIAPTPANTVGRVRSARDEMAHRGLSYGLLRYGSSVVADRMRALGEPDVGFNYLGRINAGSGSTPGGGIRLLSPVRGHWDDHRAPAHSLELNATIEEGHADDAPRLRLDWSWVADGLADHEVDRVRHLYAEHLAAILATSDEHVAPPTLLADNHVSVADLADQLGIDL